MKQRKGFKIGADNNYKFKHLFLGGLIGCLIGFAVSFLSGNSDIIGGFVIIGGIVGEIFGVAYGKYQ